VNRDGYKDLVLHFPRKDTGLTIGATSACFYGENVLATPVTGCDNVTVVK
jgi:hypothetical protein